VGRDIAGITDGQAMEVRGTPQFIDNLEGGGFLSLQAVRVNGVHDGDRCMVSDLLDQRHADIKITTYLDHYRAVDHRLGQFAQRDLAFRDQYKGGNTCARSIGCGSRRSIAGGGTDNGMAALFDGTGHRHGHTAVLEGTGGVQALVLDIEFDILAGFTRYVFQSYQGRIAFTKTDHAGIRRDRHAVAVMLNQAGITCCSRHAVNPSMVS
jgi:hypothetical protein